MKRLFCLLLCFALVPAAWADGNFEEAALEIEETDAGEDEAWEYEDWGDDVWTPADDIPAAAVSPSNLQVPAPAVVLMERDTGTVLYEKSADDKLYPASVTKIMTLLLAMEAIADGRLQYDQKISVSKAAMGMGGSTAYLHEGEQYTVEEMLKAVAVQSANDGSVVLAEAVAGTEETFVNLMNERAKGLGMTGTHFMNPHGLDHDDHYTTARDVAIMSRALLFHKDIRKYTTIWLDSLRDGTFELANTNRLVRYYDGCTGVKTGTTSKAWRCVAATAERDGMKLIAVVMNAGNTDERYDSARKMLDYGFANYTVMAVYPDEVLTPIPVILGRQTEVQPVMAEEKSVLVEKLQRDNVLKTLDLAIDVQAPVQKGQKLGTLILSCNDEILAEVDIVAAEDVEKLGWWDIFSRMVRVLFLSGDALR